MHDDRETNDAGVSRRAFLEAGMAGAAALGLTAREARATAPSRTAPAAPAAQGAPFELAEATIGDLQAGMRGGRYTARSLAERYLARIAEMDGRGPALHAMIETNPDALAI